MLRKKIASLALPIALFAFAAQAAEPSMVLLNGKIVTVDDQFSVKQAVAIDGASIVAVGGNDEIKKLAGAKTQVIDLGGRTVLPGLIDNHNHFIRGTEYWANEERLEGVRTRAEVLERLRAKARALPKGEWLFTLGGWYEDQLTGDRQDITLAELDAIAPDRPAFIQAKYDHAFVNTAWLNAMGIPVTEALGPNDKPGVSRNELNRTSARVTSASATLAGDVVRDAGGKATGRVNGGIMMANRAMQKFPTVTEESQVKSIKAAMQFYNSIGLTSIFDPGGLGIQDVSYDRIQKLADSNELTLRIMATLGDAQNGSKPEHARAIAEKVKATKPFQGNEWYDRVAVGEIYYPPFHWDDLVNSLKPSPEDVAAAKEVLMAAAAGGWQVQTHVVQPDTMNIIFDTIEEVNKVHPVRALRWSFTHADNIGRPEMERARKLGMNIQLRSQRVIGNVEGALKIRGQEAVSLMPRQRVMQDSGVAWGMGTDGAKAAQINPFITMWYSTNGKMLNGTPITKELLTREEALISHTRSNAFLMFQENYTGAIKPGLLADMVVIDRDYMTIPLDEIKDIQVVTTIVGGKIVYQKK